MSDLVKKYITNKPPFSAEILIRQEAHEISALKESGYSGTPVKVDGGIMLKITIGADTIEQLQHRIAGHVSLIE